MRRVWIFLLLVGFALAAGWVALRVWIHPQPTRPIPLASPTLPRPSPSPSFPVRTPSPPIRPSPSPTATPTPTPIPTRLRGLAHIPLTDLLWLQAYRTAESLVQERVMNEPSAYGYLLLGRVALAQGKVDQAMDAFIKAESMPNVPPELYLWRARTRERQKSWEQAVAEYRTYVRQPRALLRGYAYYQMARDWRQLGAVDKAVRAYDRAVEHALPGQAVPWAFEWADYLAELDRAEQAIALYTRLLDAFELTPAQRSRVYLARGTRYFDQGDRARAWRDLRAAIEEAVHTQQGARSARVEREAIPYAYRALLILVKENQPVDDYTRGVVDVEAGAYAPAVSVLIRYLDSVSPHHGDAHAYLARALEALGNTAGAIEQWRVLIDTHPECPCWNDAWLALLHVYRRLGMEAQARRLLAELLKHPRVSLALKERARLEVGEYLLNRGEHLAARQVLERLAYDATIANIRHRAALLAAVLYPPEEGGNAYALLRHTSAGEVHPHWAPVLTYWLADAALHIGEVEEARRLWHGLARKRPASLYAFRAAERLHALGDRVPSWRPPAASPSRWHGNPWHSHVDNVSTFLHAHNLRSKEAKLLRWGAGAADAGLEVAAVRYYSQAIDSLEEERTLLDLGYLLQDLGYPQLGIRAAYRALRVSGRELWEAPGDYWSLLYPTPARAYVRSVAEEFDLPLPLLYAVIRQESHFATSATSVAQAQGLMQVIPETAQLAARALGLRVQSPGGYYKPTINLRLGAYYLSLMFRQFGDEPVFALAGYNAGPGNVARWRTLYPSDGERFVELIPILETRIYVREVLRQEEVYKTLLPKTTESER